MRAGKDLLWVALHLVLHQAVAEPWAAQQSPCVRMFHSGGDIGCRLPERGKQAFPLLSVASQLELESFAADAAGFGKEKVAAAVPATMFTAAVVSQLEGTGVLGGLLVVDTPPPDTAKASAAAFSPEDRREGWNAHGSALLRRSLDFPVVLLSGEGGQGALEAGVSNRAHGLGSFPRYMAEFEFYFGAASISSKECLQWVDKDGARDPQCLPMGGQSSWGVLDGPYSSSDSAPSGGKPVVLLSAAMDSVSFFHNTVPAANGAASGLVALLAAADALAAAADDLHLTSLANAIGFVGDAWGGQYACNNTVPAESSPTGLPVCLNPLHVSTAFTNLGPIAAVVALDQVGILSSPHSLFLHASPAAATSSIDALLAVGADIGGDFSMGPSSTQELPPTSLDSFLENNSSVAGFVISGYDHPFADELYRSHWDTADRLDGATIQHAALAAARGVYVLAGGLLSTAMARIAVNATLVASLTDCIATDWACPLMAPYVQSELARAAALAGSGGFEFGFDSGAAPSLSSGVLAWWGGGGLPLVRRYSADGSWTAAATTNETWNPATDALFLVPSPLEMFVRAYLGEKLVLAGGADYVGGSCGAVESLPCAPCSVGEKPVPMECVAGKCICPLAHHHIALDPGLEREAFAGHYRIVDAAAELWAEPNWGTIGVSGYLDAGKRIGVIALTLGIITTAIGAFASYRLRHALVKRKLL